MDENLDYLYKYYDKLLEKIDSLMKGDYNNLDGVIFNDFEKINFFLVDNALNNNQHLFIKTIEKDEKSNFYVPIVISVALSLFFKNFCDSDIIYKTGDILQKNKQRYIIKNINEDQYILECKRTKSIYKVRKKYISEYDIVKGKLSRRKVKNDLLGYKKLFKSVFAADGYPTNFKYKAAIILDWNDFQTELNNHNCTSLDLLKSIPIQRINKNGGEYKCSLPIDSMIYVVPNYHVFQDYVKDNYNIDSVILIGKNKYDSKYFEAIENDVYNEELRKAIIIGKEHIQDNTDSFIKWNWTQPEISYIKKESIACIKSETIIDSDFIEAINELYEYIGKFEIEHFAELSDLKRFKRLLYSFILPHENSRLVNYFEWVHDLILKETENSFKDILMSQNKNDFKYIQIIKDLINKVFLLFTNKKKDALLSLSNAEILLVPKRNVSEWQNEFENNSIKVMSVNKFISKQAEFQKRSEIILPSLFGYELSPSVLIEQLSCFSHVYTFLCYDDEIIALKDLKNHMLNQNNKEYSSIYRKKLTGVEFEYQEKSENVSDLIDNIAVRVEKSEKSYEYDSQENINYALTFEENDDKLIFDGSKYVLLHNENRKEQIYNLVAGDKVRIYTNHSKEKLYDIALSEDTEGRFREIERLAKLWKECFRNYFNKKKQKNSQYSENNLLSELSQCGLYIKSPITIHNWIYKEQYKFPSSRNSLLAIKQLINCEKLNYNFKHVIEARRLYRGIMLSLGRNLSEEVMDYVLSNKKITGKILKTFTDSEVQTFVEQSLPLMTIKLKLKSEEEETR